MKKLLSFIIVICMIIVSVPISASAVGFCTPYNGDNIEDQNYDYGTTTIKSYLTKCSDGRLMRVQAGSGVSGIFVEYYDTSYNLLSCKEISLDLPIFGGFYASASNYFLITGQKNPNELSTTEVYRITKYDKNWNRLSSVGVYGANTTIPFHAGTARMVMYGDMLIIHTAHQMYRAPDGKNHQANITIGVNTATMTITKCNYSVSHTSETGYSSHSFNQFIQLQGKNVVTVDHGDAYPRSIVLVKHSADASLGQFGGSCNVKQIMTFPGEIGDNYTGASIGGFEISSSSYLIAGNTVEHNANYQNNRTRNIFVASVTDSETKINKITSFAEGEATTSTPHFVKIANDKYMLMWTREGAVYYTTIDAKGNRTSSIYSMKGNLSDCVPVVINNKLVWYVWNGTKSTFYEINLNSISQTNSTTVETGHKYEVISVDNGVSNVRCTNCGETDTFLVPTTMNVWWQTPYNTSTQYYYQNIDGDLKVNDVIKTMIKFTPVNDDVSRDFEIIVSDESILKYEETSSFAGQILGEFSLLKAGNATITIKHRYNPELTATYNVTVRSDVNVTSVSLDKSSLEMSVDDSYTLTPIFNPSNSSAICSWSSSNTAVATVDSTGKVTAKKLGTAVITLTLENNLKATCKVTVKGDYLRGDVNLNKRVDVADVICILKHCIAIQLLNEEQIKMADLDNSGNINVADALALQKLIIGLL